jgi:predicted nucleic acid-binding protein
LSELLLDASVWLAALDPDDRHYVAAKALVESTADDGGAEAGGATIDDGGAGDDSGDDVAKVDPITLTALDLTLYEVANVAVVSWSSQADAERLLELIRLACPATIDRVDEERMREAAKIATEHDLTVYDAAYVAAARRHDWTLVSCDLKDLVRPGLAIAPDAALPPHRPPEKGRSRRRRPR